MLIWLIRGNNFDKTLDAPHLYPKHCLSRILKQKCIKREGKKGEQILEATLWKVLN
jgi:hypothetical protein